ncbi:MAG: TonB-dependent siderophore receptor [Pseudorhodoferax sp.]
MTVGYEHFRDDRIADRGIPSYQGRPVATDPSTFFGNAAGSPTWSRLDAFNLSVEHEFGGGVLLRNRLRVADQDKFYQNVFASGAVTSAGLVSIGAYNNATARKSVFNQTDLTYNLTTGAIKHKLLAGMELGRQETTNFRETGFFNNTVASVNVPLSNPIATQPVTFRQNANDANNESTAKVAAFYLQDQIELSPQWQLVGGVRVDHFKTDFLNRRTGGRVDASDNLLSPRLGVIYKAMPNLSLYANYSIAYQPRAGEQLASLTTINAALTPEKFKNYELGAKWDVQPNLAVTAAVFRLDRTNVAVPDPADVTRSILVKGQRTEGFELGVSGNITPVWSVAGGYTYSDARYAADTTTAVSDGRAVGQVPRHTLSLWNRYDFTPAWGAGLGVIHRTKSFASNEQAAAAANVELPGYTRFDAAVFFKVNKNLGVQLNVENLFDKEYYANAHNNNNITPGSPRAYRVALNASF